MATEKQIAANRRNALKSTGPRTPEGKARSRWNALKHGILAKAVVAPPYSVSVCGKENTELEYCPSEEGAEFKRLYRALCEELQPAGVLEGMLVEQIACLYWRLRRVYSWEAAQVAQRKADLQSRPAYENPKTSADAHKEFFERVVEAQRKILQLAESGPFDQRKLEQLRKLLDIKVDEEIMGITFNVLEVKPSYIEELVQLAQQNPQELQRKLREEISIREWSKANEEANDIHRRSLQEQAACLPSVEVLQKAARYEAHLSKQLYKALHELIRLQAARSGQDVPVPAAVDVTIDGESGSFGKNST